MFSAIVNHFDLTELTLMKYQKILIFTEYFNLLNTKQGINYYNNVNFSSRGNLFGQ